MHTHTHTYNGATPLFYYYCLDDVGGFLWLRTQSLHVRGDVDTPHYEFTALLTPGITFLYWVTSGQLKVQVEMHPRRIEDTEI